MAKQHVITLVTRSECHLCDEARQALARVQAVTAVTWEEIDVDSEASLIYSYGDRVPVVLLDGVEHGYWRVEEARLIADLQPVTGKQDE